jgi:NDP-sugar pyrophosphorylase family protein
MINILIPMAGRRLFFSENEFPFPKPLIEIGQRTMIEHVIQNLASVGGDPRFIFILSNTDCRKFHLDSTLNLIAGDQCRIIRLDNETKGAVCSALMAINHINNENPLIIANSDQLFDDSVPEMIAELQSADAGVVTFESVHPRWSYVRLDGEGFVVETAEKRPISREAIAGLYFFRYGRDFVQAAMRSIQKDSSLNGNFYIAPTLNELILEGKKIRVTKVASHRYHTFYTPQRIKEYESQLLRKATWPK